MKRFVLPFLMFCFTAMQAQPPAGKTWETNYRHFATKINDLVHTKLDASFDYAHSYLNGKVWLTLQPHFYPTDSLQLDAKGMNIHEVTLIRGKQNIPLKYTYDSLRLHIRLDRTYLKGQRYMVYIRYTAKPDEFKAEGSAAITDAKGLYFINPTGKEKNKPTQIWTQGETESNSVWIPTIDKPDQKCTDEFILHVPAKYVSLSNGKLVSKHNNGDGTRTDTWVMDLPHSPYLFFIGIGDYAIVKDSYKGKEVSYYVEKPYEKVARKIFGYTPEMIKFFADKVTGIDFPWVKYSQIVGRDYVSGAMENTTATLHQESAQQNARELTDENSWETTIAHELFHQWFGDLVTTESWSNITVNESFADYSQYLWLEHKYGADEAGHENYTEMQSYFNDPRSRNKDLVRFYYQDREDVFDLVSYQKGGRILNMLRRYVGDSAFFASLHKYLIDNKFGNGNAHKLRLAFEAVTGQDLNWFFNQWYFGNGHPTLQMQYGYNPQTKLAKVLIEQTQPGTKLFQLPIKIDVYVGDEKKTYNVWSQHKRDSFYFPVASHPDLINVDPDRYLLAVRHDDKNLANYIFQYHHADGYLNRREAVAFALEKWDNDSAKALLKDALNDRYFRIRSLALEGLQDHELDAAIIAKVESIAKTDDHRLTRAAAIDVLGSLKDQKYHDFFKKAISDSSYSVAGAALEALGGIDSSAAFAIAKQLSKEDNKGRLLTAISGTMVKYGDASAFDYVFDSFDAMPLSQEKFGAISAPVEFLIKVKDLELFKKGVDRLLKFRDAVPGSVRTQTDPYINNFILRGLMDKKAAAGDKEMADYVKSKIP